MTRRRKGKPTTSTLAERKTVQRRTPYTIAGNVTITRPDGTTIVERPYDRTMFQEVVAPKARLARPRKTLVARICDVCKQPIHGPLPAKPKKRNVHKSCASKPTP
jgi:hypothetical protein